MRPKGKITGKRIEFDHKGIHYIFSEREGRLEALIAWRIGERTKPGIVVTDEVWQVAHQKWEERITAARAAIARATGEGES